MTPDNESIDDVRRERDELRAKLEQYQQLAIEADYVTRERFEYYGLCDSLDNNGRPYPSQWSADLVKQAKADLAGKVVPTGFIIPDLAAALAAKPATTPTKGASDDRP